MSSIPEINDPTNVVSALVEGVDKYAEGGQRDDVCLMVAVAGQA